LAPVKPLPGRRVLPALCFATAGAVVLLVLAFAADWTGLFQQDHPSNQHYGAMDAGPVRWTEEVESYWLVSGVKNSLSDNSQTSVELVVPDHTDNVYVAVDSLAADGELHATSSVTYEGQQIALTRVDEEHGSGENVKEFSVVTASDSEQSPFATNSAEVQSALDSFIKEQDGKGIYLNMVPAASDNTVLYSFDLGRAEKEVIATREDGWLRPLEYGLIGLVAVLGVATAALWLGQRRARVTEISHNKN
jgi:hypothetical protein